MYLRSSVKAPRISEREREETQATRLPEDEKGRRGGRRERKGAPVDLQIIRAQRDLRVTL